MVLLLVLIEGRKVIWVGLVHLTRCLVDEPVAHFIHEYCVPPYALLSVNV